jgi:hypothetical protein
MEDSGNETKHGSDPAEVLAAASAVIWAAAALRDDPVDAIGDAQGFAIDVIERLVARIGPGRHLATCLAKRSDGESILHAGLSIVRRGCERAIRDTVAEQAFGALLMLGHLACEPVGVLLRSCSDAAHHVPGHTSTVQGWLVLDGHARPLSAASIRVIAGLGGDDDGPGPRSGAPPHPETGVRYRQAFSLYEP